MPREVNCRTGNTIIQYIRKYRPEVLPGFLEGFTEEELSNEHFWIDSEQMDMLYQRVEKLFCDPAIMLAIGREAVRLGSTGIVDLLFRLDYDPMKTIKLSVQYATLFSTITQIKIHEISSQHAIVERQMKRKVTRGSCCYTKGLYYAMLEGLRVKRCQIIETHCAVPIWEQGRIGKYCFSLENGHVWREDVKEKNKKDMGPIAADNTFLYNGVLYGAPSCIYHLKWTKRQNLWMRFRQFINLKFGRLEKLKEEFFYEYEVVERQNRQLLHNNRRLEELLRERTILSKSLEKRVNDRTMELEDTVTQLKELDEMKSYFLSITSHELRTPLTIINGALNLLLTDGDQLSPERYRKYMLMAKNNAEHLNKLISNLLDLSRLESGQLKLEVEKIDVVRLVRESLEEFREIAKKNNLQLFYEMSGEHPEFIGDSLRIKQIVDNLLSNAVKFTPSRGEIRLHLSMDEKQMEVRVSDNGLGIEDWEKEKIFKKFQQSERSLTRESAGVGLGLAIVRDLVKLHEGTIVVESEKGKGSTFIVRIPKFSSGKSENIVRKKSRDDHEPPKILGNK